MQLSKLCRGEDDQASRDVDETTTNNDYENDVMSFHGEADDGIS